MLNTCLDHPLSNLLERFVSRRCTEDELEVIESHILACDLCLTKLEQLENEIAPLNQFVLGQLPRGKPATEKARFWERWLCIPNLSWASAVGVLAVAFCTIGFIPTDVQLRAERADVTFIVPEWRHTHLRFTDEGLPAGTLQAEVTDESGNVLWSKTVNNNNGLVDLDLPIIRHRGHYYARLYTIDTEHDLLTEVRFDVEWRFWNPAGVGLQR
jgi:hypothetical protein